MIEEMEDTSALPAAERWNDVPGYKSFGEASKEVEEVVNVVWVSGTRTHSSCTIQFLVALTGIQLHCRFRT